MSALRFALVGCGGIARHHLKALGGCAHPTQVAAVVDERRDNAVELAKLIPPDQTPAENCQVGGWGYSMHATDIAVLPDFVIPLVIIS